MWVTGMVPGVLAAQVGLLLMRLKCLIPLLTMEISSSKSEILLMPSITIRLDMFMTNGGILTIQNRAIMEQMASTHSPPMQHKSFTSWEIFTISECTRPVVKLTILKELYLFGKALLLSAQPHGLTSSVLDTSISHLSLLEPIRSRHRFPGNPWMSKTTQ